MTLVLTDESKDTFKTYEERWNKVRDAIRSITNNSDNYDKKHMKIKFNSDNDLSPKKTLKLYNTAMVVRCVFQRGNEYYPRFLRRMFV